MAWTPTAFEGVYIYTPSIFRDERGYFIESFNHSKLPEEYKDVNFVQDNESKSSYGIIRGLHYQTASQPQAKLVRCIVGEVLDVIVDIRKGSATYGKHLSVVLNEINKKQMYVPHGFAHGFAVLSEMAIFAYKCDGYYAPQQEGSIRFDDPTLGINWILAKDKISVSGKDAQAPMFGLHKPFEEQ